MELAEMSTNIGTGARRQSFQAILTSVRVQTPECGKAKNGGEDHGYTPGTEVKSRVRSAAIDVPCEQRCLVLRFQYESESTPPRNVRENYITEGLL